MLEEFNINALSVMALCTLLANRFEAQGHGTIAVISSVAGDRGRQSNYVYGSAKAAVSAFTSGMRQRLHSNGLRVLTIKPGFVNTPMTTALKKGALWASPPTVAHSIARDHRRRQRPVHTVVLVADHDDHPRDSGAHFRQAQTVIPPRRWGDL